MISLHATGCARLLFRPDQTTPIFEGVLIANDTEDMFGLVGQISQDQQKENENQILIDINVTEGETGQVYIVRRVELITTDNAAVNATVPGLKISSTDEEEMAVDAGVETGAIENAPSYELRSDVLQFTTEEILVGNRADKDISTYLNPDLIGKQLRVHLGPMSIHFSASVASKHNANLEQMHEKRRLHHVSIGGGSEKSENDQVPPVTDALM